MCSGAPNGVVAGGETLSILQNRVVVKEWKVTAKKYLVDFTNKKPHIFPNYMESKNE